MNCKKQFSKITTALLLFMALMLPTAIQFIHMCEGHEHNAFTEKQADVHKLEKECEICSFDFTAFDEYKTEYPDLLLPKIPVKTEIDFFSLQLHSFTITNTQLRAPPVFS